MHKNRFIFWGLIFIVVQSAYGEEPQKYFLNEEKRIDGSISATEMNRIKIQGERISEIVGLEGEFVLESDEVNGQLFLKTVGEQAPGQQAVFSVITESGKTQDFKLFVKSNLAGQVLIIENNYQTNLPPLSQMTGIKNIRHEEIILLLRKAYEAPISAPKPKGYKSGDMEIVLANNIASGKYQVQIWKIKNIGTRLLQLTEKQFVDAPNTMAIAIENRFLEVGAITRLFKVIQHA